MFRNQLDLMAILRSITGILGCFLSCFRIKDDRKHQLPLLSDQSSTTTNQEENDLIPHCNLSNLFLSQENEGCFFDNPTYQSMGIPVENNDDNELKAEEKFLKACGTLLETPAEIPQVYGKIEGSPSHGGDFDPFKFHSLLPDSPTKSLHSEEKPDWVPVTATKDYEALGNESDSPVHTPESLVSEEQETSGKKGSETETPYVTARQNHPIENISAVTPGLPLISTQKNKSVRFELQLDTEPYSLRSYLSKTAADNLERSNSSDSDSGSYKSTFLTPSIITDDMQTPGTIYPSSQKNLASGKRIRSQYVCSVLRPIDNLSEWKTLNKEDLDMQQMGYMIQSIGKHENANPEASVSKTIPGGRLQSRISDMDRPILGIVASHWNFEEPSRVSNQLLVWNGIPNSTRKYKEDQKISWHATPFEERLEKALSEEKLISQREFLSGRPIDFDEHDECTSSG